MVLLYCLGNHKGKAAFRLSYLGLKVSVGSSASLLLKLPILKKNFGRKCFYSFQKLIIFHFVSSLGTVYKVYSGI